MAASPHILDAKGREIRVGDRVDSIFGFAYEIRELDLPEVIAVRPDPDHPRALLSLRYYADLAPDGTFCTSAFQLLDDREESSNGN